ncbi:hypothetical protein [Nocardia stercoris]|uniref:hypothetical protein n=1 Tax=Nocardia stercoris TaxID=2483361 RepID=UPI0011C4261E|nr:hypothetical protein [Nocardia stercoris]
MRRYLIALAACMITLGASACDYTDGAHNFPGTSSTPRPASPTENPTDFVPPSNSRSVSVPSAITPAKLRNKTCAALIPRLDNIRRTSGQPGVDRAVDDTIGGYPSSPDWAVFTDEQRQATIDGAHDAATGVCPAG